MSLSREADIVAHICEGDPTKKRSFYRSLGLKLSGYQRKKRCGNIKAVFRIGSRLSSTRHERRIPNLFRNIQCSIRVFQSPYSSNLISIVGECPTNEPT
ncbi:hypothetical protein TNCV_3179941 [Trichonephila clavipes]|nr:hypothetical protein TNCV_3179941 [Trichonephila clavipes]